MIIIDQDDKALLYMGRYSNPKDMVVIKCKDSSGGEKV